MAKKTKKTETTTQSPAVVLREGKWVTADGLCFNTATKAWKHVEELKVESEKLKVVEACNGASSDIPDTNNL